jgi:hypothetical protein
MTTPTISINGWVTEPITTNLRQNPTYVKETTWPQKARPQKAWEERGQEKRQEAADPRVPMRA